MHNAPIVLQVFFLHYIDLLAGALCNRYIQNLIFNHSALYTVRDAVLFIGGMAGYCTRKIMEILQKTLIMETFISIANC